MADAENGGDVTIDVTVPGASAGDANRDARGGPSAEAAGDSEPSKDGTSGDSPMGDGNTADAQGPGADSGAEAEAEAAPVCVENDAGCASANPGACASGILRCDGGASVCEPLQSMQPCYSGPSSTRSVGNCHDGTQSCIGTLGACTGEVDPMPHENCFNTTDDDCDGVVNNGCPQSVALGADDPIGAAGGGGGGLGSVHCPAGAFVTRVDSWFDDADQKASGVSIYCATPTLLQGASTYSVTLAANTPAPYATLTGGAGSPTVERADDCGISGLVAITYSDGLADSYVEGLGQHCGTSSVTLNADNTIVFDFVATGDQSFNAYTGSTAPFFIEQCPSNEVVVGFNLRTGAFLDQIQPICAALVVKYK
jgi:hypothetical protein